jgi:hypothetical protein
MMLPKSVIVVTFSLLSLSFRAQTSALEIAPEKERLYSVFMLGRHGGIEGLAEFKKTHPHEYLTELWYQAESFYIKRNVRKDGQRMDESGIDIVRFEKFRKENEEYIVPMEGFKDELILLPESKLLFKPRN